VDHAGVSTQHQARFGLVFRDNTGVPRGDHFGGLPLPTTILVFTALEASTASRARHPAAMHQPWSATTFLSDSISESGGVILGHTGEGCCATFDSVAAAALATACAQRRLASADGGELEIPARRRVV
jgi:hypothetical protein